MIQYQKSLSVKYETDVFVAGGGPAGLTAAVAAARGGKKVFLAEASGMFGGLATTALVPAFAPFTDGVNVLASGIGLELRNAAAPDLPVSTYWTPIRAEALKRACDTLAVESGIEFSFFTRVCDVIVKNGHVEYVVCDGKSGLFAVKAAVYIDCTGDGDLCAAAGASFSLGDENGEVMPSTLCSQWANIDFSVRKISDDSKLDEAIRDGVFSIPDRHLPGMQIADRASGVGGGNISHTYVTTDPTDEVSLTKGMVDSRARLPEYEAYYKKYLKGYEHMTLVNTGSVLGVRESRRILCDYTLNVDDFLSRAVFEDEIGRYCYPIDIHRKYATPEEYEAFIKEYFEKYRYKNGESYGIPYRSLVVRDLDNVLVAGRCMGVDKPMQASIRVIPGCYITGQAAGAAAAIAVQTGDIRKVETDALKKALISLGAYLPNA